jgi:hypothetical protein
MCVVLGLMTSVGVAWGIAWNTDGMVYSSSPSWGVQIVRRSDGTGKSMGWTVTRAGWHSEYGPLARNWFESTSSPEDDVAERKATFSVDLEAEFDRLAGDAASRRALSRHRPLLLSGDGRHVVCSVTLAGWPVRCLAMENACTREAATRRKNVGYLANMASDAPPRTSDTKRAITDPAFNLLPHYNAIEVGDHLLPTFPLWPGLLANTAFYSGAWAVVIFTPLFVRRWLRARRGGCSACGYSREGLKADAPCPECGRGV